MSNSKHWFYSQVTRFARCSPFYYTCAIMQRRQNPAGCCFHLCLSFCRKTLCHTHWWVYYTLWHWLVSGVQRCLRTLSVTAEAQRGCCHQQFCYWVHILNAFSPETRWRLSTVFDILVVYTACLVFIAWFAFPAAIGGTWKHTFHLLGLLFACSECLFFGYTRVTTASSNK